MSEDIELVRQIGRGDEAAFHALVDREGRYLHGIAHALTGNAADAEDLVQETFTGALTSRFRGESSLRTWLVRILVRRVGMLRRSRRRRGPQQSLETESRDERDIGIAKPSETPGTEARLDLSTMLASLSPEHRAAIVLRELQGMTYAEMAATLEVPQGTVESRLYRAREELRKRFKGYLQG
ncbi:MAG TPA: sigma-70 family RNA polymerase sigma factor [Phycisphaerae bacterium]|nr:sigma-70 family RNA polymerase sigma factor [Phycisphaerae bacterium]